MKCVKLRKHRNKDLKMRVTLLLLKNGRKPGTEPVPFKELLPLQLRNKVSGKGEKTANVACLQEMAVMFACMKDSDFKEVKCTKEIETFQKCYTEHMTLRKERKQREASGQVVVGRDPRKLSTAQLNQLLQKYPQVNTKKII